MTEEAKRNLRQLDTETDAVWAERGRLIEDVRNVATALFSLAEDAADRFPEDGERAASGATATAAAATMEPMGQIAATGAPARMAAPPPGVASSPGAAPAPVAAAPAPAVQDEDSEDLPD